MRSALVVCMALMFAVQPALAQLRGHGGPVRAVAVSADGKTAISGSFDASAIRWSLERNAAEQVLRFHESAVNAVAMARDGTLITAGEDGQIALWPPGASQPAIFAKVHDAPIVSLSVSPDGATLASGSWDRTVRLRPLAGGTDRVLEGHQQNVNGVAFTPDGRALVSVSYDATLRIWLLAGGGTPIVATLPTPLNAVAVAPDGEIVTAGADGKIYFLSPQGEIRGELQASPTPIVGLTVSGNGALIAAAGIRGSVAVVTRAERQIVHTLVGPGLPVWSLTFLPDNRTLLTGGADRLLRRWNAITGEHIGTIAAGAPEDPLAAYAGDRGADIFRACIACHTLNADDGHRAGPTLAGIFGRKIATLPGYNFSEPLKQLDIVWTPETVAKLFEVGPAAYTPGTKMPEQTIGSPEDRDALVRFLEKATKKN